MPVYASDDQHDEGIDLDRWVRLAEGVLAAEGVSNDAELSLLFVDETTMADLNQRFMGAPGPTDVLAFPIDAGPETGRQPPSALEAHGPWLHAASEAGAPPRLLGDVVICPAVAARRQAHDVTAELALLVVHGVLHVLGHDHAEPDEAARMEIRQRQLLHQLYRPPELS